ncbi:MAG: peptide chain release factor N(5)-glutamine methyltransferase [Marinilabiliaceae bacterium]|nr:peptide chain release factor N(5)-glutamine methyltransferase [Marinilabiliaceae bacterium]
MTTISHLRRELTNLLSSHEKASYLLEDFLGMTTTQLIIEGDKNLSDETTESLRSMARRIRNGEPLQYVTGRAYFAGEYYSVNPSVLIPRPETSQLIEWVSQKLANHIAPSHILDIGTGSGIIAIELKKIFPAAHVVALDVSQLALDVASDNAKMIGVDIEFIKDDILNPCKLTKQYNFDLVVSNPPYVMEGEKTYMELDVLNHEPHIALFVPDDDPLRFYVAITKLLSRIAKPTCSLFFEINEALSKEVVSMMVSEGLSDVECRDDFNGKPRMVYGLYSR